MCHSNKEEQRVDCEGCGIKIIGVLVYECPNCEDEFCSECYEEHTEDMDCRFGDADNPKNATKI